MAINFPASPSTNDTFTAGSITYKWDGAKWIGLGVTPADRLVEGSNSLEITATNDLVWTGDSVLLGTATANVNDRLTVHDPGSAFMSIRSDVASDGNSQVLDFGVGTADRSSANLTAVIEADIHSTAGGTLKADLVFQTNAGNSISDKMRLTSDGNLGIGVADPAAKLEVRDSGAQGVIIRATNTQNTTTNKALRIRNNSNVDTASISHRGTMMLGTNVPNSFNGVGQEHGLIVAGSTSDTDITDNSRAAITISNTDGTANNTAGLHFAREDTDANPHYCGASIVAQFKETQVTGQYPKADLVFLTSLAANNAPSEKMRVHANGALTLPSNPALRTNPSATYGAQSSLIAAPLPPVSILQTSSMFDRGDTGWSTTGTNAYTFVCPVDGIYAVFANISLSDVSQTVLGDSGNRIIFSMGYTLGGGNLPLANYVEVIDTNEFDYQNTGYYNVWFFTAGTRVGMGMNGVTGVTNHTLEWGIHLVG